ADGEQVAGGVEGGGVVGRGFAAEGVERACADGIVADVLAGGAHEAREGGRDQAGVVDRDGAVPGGDVAVDDGGERDGDVAEGRVVVAVGLGLLCLRDALPVGADGEQVAGGVEGGGVVGRGVAAEG